MATTCEPLSESGEVFSLPTNWADISRAREPGDCLNRVVERYTERIREYAERKWGRNIHGCADDFAQSFLLKMLEGRVVKYADKRRGKFRRFLLRSFNNHVIDALRKRKPAVSDQLDSLPTDFLEHSELDRICTEEMVRDAGTKVFTTCQQREAPEIFRLITDQIMDPILHGTEPLSQAELVSKYNYASSNVVSGKMRTARKWFRQAVRDVVSQYASSDDLDQEVADFVATIPRAVSREVGDISLFGCMYSYMVCDLAMFGGLDWTRTRKTCGVDGNTLKTYFDALSAKAPHLSLLMLIKRFAKSQLGQPGDKGHKSRIPKPAAKLLYYLSIAVAREKHAAGSDFSTLERTSLRKGLAACRHQCKDQHLRTLIDHHLQT